MKPTELRTLFSEPEQTLLVRTEAARLAVLTEDELADLLTAVRRARNKYTKLYRRQSSALVDQASSRAGTSTSNTRTKRKAEIFEDALSRVAKFLSRAAKASADELKAERLAAAAAGGGSPKTAGGRKPAADTTKADRAARPKPSQGAASASRQGSTKAAGARNQARRDSR
jgi:hypothetical protein